MIFMNGLKKQLKIVKSLLQIIIFSLMIGRHEPVLTNLENLIIDEAHHFLM